MKKSSAVLVLVFLSACGGGSSSTPPPPTVSSIEAFTQSIQNLTLDDFYHVSFGGLLSRSPETLVSSALDDIYPQAGVRLNDWSLGYRADTWTIYQLALDKLLTYDRSTLSVGEQLNYDVYLWYLQDFLDEQEFDLYSFPATYSLFGVQRGTQRFFEELHPVETAQDAMDFVFRLRAFDTKFEQLRAHLLRQRQAGIVEPALTMQVAMSQLSAYAQIPSAQNSIYISFRDKINSIAGLTSAERDDFIGLALDSVTVDVIPAYQNLFNTLQALLNDAPPDIGVGQYPRGSEYYDYILRHHTTTDLTAAEIHQLGLDELARIHTEMRVIFDQLGYPQNETLQELYTRVETDGGIVLAAD